MKHSRLLICSSTPASYQHVNRELLGLAHELPMRASVTARAAHIVTSSLISKC